MNRELLKAEMDKRGLNKLQLAEISGVDPSAIVRILNGDREPGIKIAAKIVNAMKLKPTVATKIFFED